MQGCEGGEKDLPLNRYQVTRYIDNFTRPQKTMIWYGDYDIPRMARVDRWDDASVTKWIGLSDISNSYVDKSKMGVSLYLEPDMLEKAWKRPDAYIQSLRNYCAVLSPPYPVSKYDPFAVQIYNVYRNRWMGAYWQQNGINVIPTITWGGKESYDMCFRSVNVGSVIAISSELYNVDREVFLDGFREMYRTIMPTKILWFGSKVYKDEPHNIVHYT